MAAKPLIASKVYFSSERERLLFTHRARKLGKSLSRHIRDLLLRDYTANEYNPIQEEEKLPSTVEEMSFSIDSKDKDKSAEINILELLELESNE